MKGITKYLIVVSLVCYSVTGCTEKKGDTFDAEHEKNEIIKMTGERFKRMMATDNPNEIAQIYTENTVEVPVYMPQNDEVLIGKEAIRGWGEKFFGKYRLTVGKPYKGLYDEWLLSPEMAVHRYESRGYFIDRATKDSIFSSQKTVDVFKKENGIWLYSSHTWNTNSDAIIIFNPVCDSFDN
ncbi:hypothetical protein [Jejuia pallidilutea]|uniref:Ketosteroid isomerase-like protein n=2 Tax=Jejuia pallidilutea TaxID=504487 RepID=A0A098LRG2_9FLAO|nr:hypothetical protein [Jejuia pallidilutea]GAL89491.1 hypothetical protein JCM19538_1728 [Jejuia pallidilutea]